MKRLLSLCRSIAVRGLMILLLPMSTYAQQCSEDTRLARLSPAMVGGSTRTSCTTVADSYTLDASAGQIVFGGSTTWFALGLKQDITPSAEICGFSIQAICNDELLDDCGGRTFTGRLYEVSGTTLGTMRAESSAVAFSSSTRAELKFTFATPYTVTDATDYAYVIVPSAADASKHIRFYYNDVGDPGAARRPIHYKDDLIWSGDYAVYAPILHIIYK